MEKSYYNENRYYDADATEGEIKLEVDKNSPIYTNYEKEYIDKLEAIKKLEEFINTDSVIKSIVDKIPTADLKKKVSISIEETNKFYSFCKIKLQGEYTNVEIFDIATSYLQVEPRDFYAKLSIKFKEALLKELEESGHYKSKALF